MFVRWAFGLLLPKFAKQEFYYHIYVSKKIYMILNKYIIIVMFIKTLFQFKTELTS